MGIFKCCVGGCNATSNTHRLFSFPKNDTLRNLWMSFLVPTNSLLIGLSKEQLLRKRVCEKHFDKHQFGVNGKRLRESYPCLFTDAEIAHGAPLSSVGIVPNALNDHNYYKEKSDEDDDVTDSLIVIGRAGENYDEHPSCSYTQPVSTVIEALKGVHFDEQPSCSYAQPVSSVTEAPKGVHFDEQPSCSNAQPVSSVTEAPKGVHFDEQPSCSYAQPVSSVTEAPKDVHFDEQPSCSYVQPVSSFTGAQIVTKSKATIEEKPKCQSQKDSVMKKLGSKKKKFIKHVKKVASESLGTTAMQRLEKATLYGSNEQLFNNFYHLTKQAQTFLIMQLKQCRRNKMARRFTMDEKLIALTLLKQSPKSYRLLENMFALPNRRTLHRLSEKIFVEPGLNPKVFDFIKRKIRCWNTHQKLCTIVFDEISLTPHLTYNERSDQIHGFVDVAGERKMRFCDHALVFMLRGICASWRQSVAFYFCEGTVPAATLQNILKQLVSQVAQTGLIPLGLVCDQGSTFRTAIKTFRENTLIARQVENVKDDGSINIAGHDLSMFFDPPHLLKGLRNNFLNKNIIWEGKTASWKDIQFIFDLDCKLGHTRALPKLTEHHVNPDKIKKMKVSVAAQVFSARTAAMLKYTNALNNLYSGNSNTMETTAEVVEFFDNLFDSVNGYPGSAARGKLRKAVKANSLHQPFWTEAIKKIKDLKFEDASSKLALQAGKPRLVRVPSLEGWITTLESFIRISKLLFQKYDVKYYYPRFINQDPLENFFGRIRALNYRNINPDTNTFLYSYKSLLLSNLLSPQSKFANCEEDTGDTLIDVNFLFEDTVDENSDPNSTVTGTVILPSTSQPRPTSLRSGSITKDEVMFEKIKVQCSAYTAGYICRQITKKIQCNSCLQTYTSSSTDNNIYTYLKNREYKMLKHNNLSYPSSMFLILYRDASILIHNNLNINGCKKNIGKNIKSILSNQLRFSWLGCCKGHSKILKKLFLKNIIRLHVHNWCNILNKILKGDIQEKYVSKMGDMQITALRKYKSYRLRKKILNK